MPDCGLTKPEMQLNSVVLPAPFGPITPSTSPPATPSETLSSAVIPPKRTVTPCTASAAEPVRVSLDTSTEVMLPLARDP